MWWWKLLPNSGDYYLYLTHKEIEVLDTIYPRHFLRTEVVSEYQPRGSEVKAHILFYTPTAFLRY